MSLVLTKDTGVGQKVLPTAEEHEAICIGLVDLGTQETEYEGKKKNQYKIKISWELTDQTHVWKEEEGEQRLRVHKTYTVSMDVKSNLRKDLKSWRGRDFTEKELEGFDIKNLLGTPCFITIAHKKSSKGNMYANIDLISKWRGANSPIQEADNQIFFINEWEKGSREVFAELPDFIRDDIMKSPEWKALGVTVDVTEEVEVGAGTGNQKAVTEDTSFDTEKLDKENAKK